MFITMTWLDIAVEQSDIYSFQSIHQSIHTNLAEIMSEHQNGDIKITIL